jgi:hypothetical protein
MTARYYAVRPIEPTAYHQVLTNIADQVLNDLLSGAVTSRTVKFVVGKYGPIGAANEVTKVIERQGDYLVVDGVQYLISTYVQAELAVFIRIAVGITVTLYPLH